MINLRDYILEKFSVAGNESDKILLFDVDDTLLKSEVQVHVVKGGKLLRKLSSAEYNSYKLQPGEDFDYAGLVKKEPNSKMLLPLLVFAGMVVILGIFPQLVTGVVSETWLQTIFGFLR